jgi:membrane-bound serine protease (ClpP class)
MMRPSSQRISQVIGCSKSRYIRVAALMILVALFIYPFESTPASAETGRPVAVLTVEGTIDTWISSYVQRGIRLAERERAETLLILLNTPGGTLNSMQDVTTSLLNASVPIVVYVYPSGAWAGSAGAFVCMAANIAAMAPGTTIGAAHPVTSTGADIGPDERAKVTNFSISAIESIAEQRGHNAEWAARAVSESLAATAGEALDLRVVDVVAENIDDLLAQIDGRTVSTVSGQVSLQTQNSVLVYHDMNLSERFFHTLVDPNVALMLLSIGLLAISVELYHPGSVFPGAVGAVCLILALVALGNLAANWGAVVLIVLAVVCFLLDIKVSGFGLTIAGAVMFVLGGLLLYTRATPSTWTAPQVSASPAVVLSLAGVTAGLFAFVLGAAVHSLHGPVLTGREALMGLTGVAVSVLSPVGQVRVRGELWSARSQDGTIPEGALIRIVGIEGLHILVKRDRAETD